MILVGEGRRTLSTVLDDKLRHVQCAPDTRAYIAGVLLEAPTPAGHSVVLAFRDAELEGRFEGFQRLGDSVLWSRIVTPEYASEHAYVMETIAQMCYERCHRLMMRRWRLYQELADELPRLTREARDLPIL